MIEINSGIANGLGVVLDIIGAFFLSQGLIFKKLNQIEKESNSYFDGNPFLLPSYIIQRIEARVGFGFLLIGFSVQLLSNTNLLQDGKIDNTSLTLICVLGLLVWASLFLFIEKFGTQQAQKIVIKKEGEIFLRELNTSKDSENYENLAIFYADALGFARKHMETTREYAIRTHAFLKQKIDK